MRLDKWLKVSRLIKRRTVANEACDNERISANGRVVKASYDVKVGDKLEIRFGARTVTLEVLSVTEMKGKENAALCTRSSDPCIPSAPAEGIFPVRWGKILGI